MTERLLRFFRSYRTTVLLMALYALLTAGATLIEKYAGTPAARALVYHSPLFLLLHAMMAANFLCITLAGVGRKNPASLLVHGGFIVILAGALVTHLTGREGTLHLREGAGTSTFLPNGSRTTEKLPFTLVLKDFRVERYPGSHSPSSYESRLEVLVDGEVRQERIYMNHVLDIKGFRLFQASYDQDERGSILSVNRDAAGRRITYTGYLLLFAGLLASLTRRDSRFRRLCRQLKAMPLLLLLLSLPVLAGAAVDRTHAERFGRLPVQTIQGRIVPANTLASELMRKLQVEEREDLGPEQFLLGLLFQAPHWAGEDFIPVAEELQPLFGRTSISYRDAFDRQGRYLLGGEVEAACRKDPSLRSRREKEMLKLDEKINLVDRLFRHGLLRLFPIPGDSLERRWAAPGEDLHRLQPADSADAAALFGNYRLAVTRALRDGGWAEADRALGEIAAYQRRHCRDISDGRIRAEVTYNRLDPVNRCRKGYLVTGGLLLAVAFCSLYLTRGRKFLAFLSVLLPVCTGICFLIHTAALGVRWYISGFVPWSNAYETMVTLAWASVLGGFLFLGRSRMAAALATLFGGVVLFVSGLSWMDPQITPLVPVLKSPWLMFHVACIMASYGFFGISCMLGTADLLIHALGRGRQREKSLQQIRRMTVINELSLTLGLVLLTTGIFLGAVWANESWGRYWSWDPKETWALTTAVTYALVLHLRRFRPGRDILFNLLSQLSFLTVLMTYFGVNRFLSGMHAYGSTGSLPLGVTLLLALFFLLPAILVLVSRGRKAHPPVS